MQTHPKKINHKGFTLVEMVVAVSLFVVIVTISIGAILSVFDANKKARTMRSVVDSLNFTIENMARTVRFGDSYHCGSGGTLSSPQNCPDSANGDTFLAIQNIGLTTIYRLNGGNYIERSDNGGLSYTRITPPEVVVQHLRFYVFGSATTDTAQPYVVAVVKGYVGNKPTSQSSFSIETVMSQRILDL